jgi:hypothetical protein
MIALIRVCGVAVQNEDRRVVERHYPAYTLGTVYYKSNLGDDEAVKWCTTADPLIRWRDLG